MIKTEKSDAELKYRQEYEDGGIIVPDDFNEKEINDH